MSLSTISQMKLFGIIFAGIPGLKINILMQAAPRIELCPTIWAASVSILCPRQPLTATATEYRILFSVVCGCKFMILQCIVALITGIIFPASAAEQHCNILSCMIMDAPPRCIQINSVNPNVLRHVRSPFLPALQQTVQEL